jgi:DNA end-binding protein Ku
VRSIWNGAVSFGLVSIPVKLMNATDNHAISFRQIHKEDGGRIRYRKICELDEQEVETADIGKGYEDADGMVIPITDADLAALPLPTAKTIEILAFVQPSTIDPLQMDTAYYLTPNGVPAAKPYTLLREALKRSEKVAVAKFALRGRERLGMLRVVDDVVAMHGLLWPDEIRAAEGVAPESDVTVRDAELDLADALMNTLGEVDLDSLHDEYREAVDALITAKAEGETLPRPEPSDGGGKVIDLMSALENSVRAAKGAGPDKDQDAQVTQLKDRQRKPAPRKQTAQKKTPARKSSSSTAAKKTTAAKKSTSGSRGTATKKTAAAKKSTGAKKSSTSAQGKRTSA